MSILDSIRQLLGQEPDAEGFDLDIIIGINSAIMALNQIGVGKEGFRINGSDETWEDFLEGKADLEAAKTYVYLKTRLAFDTPSNSFVTEALKDQIREYEWRLNINAERGDT